jgi:hypothetical protein
MLAAMNTCYLPLGYVKLKTWAYQNTNPYLLIYAMRMKLLFKGLTSAMRLFVVNLCRILLPQVAEAKKSTRF